MTTATAIAPSASVPEHTNDAVAQLLTQALNGAFDSIKGKVTAKVQENGEEYLHQAAEKIKESTASVIAWAKENPVKTALAVAALAAVSTFLVRMMTSSHNVVDEATSTAAKAKTKTSGRSNKASATR